MRTYTHRLKLLELLFRGKRKCSSPLRLASLAEFMFLPEERSTLGRPRYLFALLIRYLFLDLISNALLIKY